MVYIGMSLKTKSPSLVFLREILIKSFPGHYPVMLQTRKRRR